jgi:putative endopeptidase
VASTGRPETSRDSYIGNVLAANEFNYKWQLGKIGKPVDKTEWGMSPQTVNAYYSSQRNEIVFPAAILQPPFFDAKADDATNYGGIGAVIGHEMIHGYDDQGAASARPATWRTGGPSRRKGFESRRACSSTSSTATKRAEGQTSTASLTLGENIADLGGLNVAYAAMKKATDGTPDPKTEGFTRDQRFFLNFGTVWRRSFTDKELEAHRDRRARTGELPRDRRAVEHARVRGRVLVQAGRPDGARRRQAIVIW